MTGFIQDLRYGVRMLVKNPGFALVAILSIGIGVGANAAMFSLADGLVLRPLQVPRANEIVAVNTVAPRANDTFITSRQVSYPDYVDLRARSSSFTGTLAYRVLIASFALDRNQPAQTKLGLAVSGNFFNVLELQPAAGRVFLPDEDRVPGRDAVIVLSYQMWADQFGSDPGVVGRRVRLSDREFTVVGVAPERFAGMHLALPPAFYVPLAITVALPGTSPDALERRDFRMLDVRARLKPGISFDQAREEVALIAKSLEQTYPDTNRNTGMLVRTAFNARLDERGASAPVAFMLITLAMVVLLVACANVAGLLMSRAPARQREISLRLAIGGGRLRVTRQLLTESVLLAVGGGALGLALGYGGAEIFHRLPLVSDIGVKLTFELDRRAITVGLVLAAASAILSTLIPAWRATQNRELAQTLRTSMLDARGPRRLWGRNGLVVAQVALALILLKVTVSLGRAFEAELSRPGFRTERILLASFEPRLARYDAQQTAAFFTRLKERARALPDVMSIGMTSVMPLNQDNRDPATIVPEGFQLPRGTESVTLLSSRIDEGYLDTMGIAVVRGRGIAETDDASTPRVILVNEAMAARYWPGQDPIGKRVRFVDREGQPSAQVVGVTADNKYNFIGEGATPWLYLPQRQDQGTRSTLLVGTRGNAADVAAPLRAIVREIDPNMPLASVRTIEDFYFGNAIGIVLTLTRITGSMGILGLTLAIVGLYGLVAYAVARRTREIGIRMAVGAKPQRVLASVLTHGMMLAACGIVLGIVGSIAVGGLIAGIFPNAGGTDIVSYLLVVPLLTVVTLAAAYIPAHRASRINPLIALRAE